MFGFILYLFLIIGPSQDKTLPELRKLYPDAAVKKEVFDKMKKLVEKSTGAENVLQAYKGSLKMIEANYVVNPITKLNYFNEGKALLEKSIKKDEQNVELRYLRFTIQSKAPSILGYSDQLKSDKTFLLKQVNSISDATLKKNVLSFLKSSDQLTAEEKKKLND